MKKNKMSYILIIIYLVLVIVMTYFNIRIERVIQILAIVLIFLIIFLFESKEIDSKTLAIVATMSTLAGILRVPFTAIPGVQPVTFICAVSGYTLGGINGFMVGSMSTFISNFFIGHGPWTPWQMIGWGLCGLFFGIFRGKIEKKGIKAFVILCGIWGYIYGFILNQWYVLEFMTPVTIKTILMGSVLSFSHDTLHALGNMIFAKFFGENFIEVLERYNKRNTVIRIRK
ncbi:ECF transporter S component [Clostridium tetani]|uniref:ECF transporter S component n=1 Tax=Clostridium tetani TaxID=1513 RepID=A0ABY0ERA6_CLOTA|nr:ECF transporter S component [Clostridium tetani]CDI48809.1 metal ion ABC transporter membrane-spanningsubunit [Clostridium tetani 12124569]KHO39832.1 cobalamin ABC transporter [Clostridium tetani]RXI38380.1 ECF transporter S component [Clostridium tetani]RXI54573.1 ECF transporter S component [Clostridium tetani]RXI69095.1 ECF transporter S component [Clostridium tetani]